MLEKNINLKIFALLAVITLCRSDDVLLSHSICDIIEKFFSKYSRNLDVIDFDGTQGDLVSKIMENLNNSMTVSLIKRENVTKWTNILDDQTILLFDNFNSLNDFNNQDMIQIRYIKPIRILVHCVNVTANEISELKTDLVIPPYYYFIVISNENSKIQLYTFENRDDLKACHESQRLIQCNEFSSTELEWMNIPVFPKKYTNFHGCEMSIGSRANSNFDVMYEKPNNDVQPGLTVILLGVISHELNFSLLYMKCTDKSCTREVNPSQYLYNFVHTVSIDGYALNHGFNNKWQYVMLNIQCIPQLLIPPSDLYTSFEKMSLPFDAATWMGFGLIFLGGITIIFIINQMPTRFQKYIYGKSNHTPSLNFFLSFFGETQTSLPDKCFTRIIWVFFIFYCLVFRTTYQGKLFEFTTTEIRKPEMRTLTELRENGFKLYVVKGYTDATMNLLKSMLNLDIEYVPWDVYTKIYTENITDPLFKGTILTSDIDHAMSIFYSETPYPKRYIPIPITKSFYSIGFLFPNLWDERLQEMISKFITGGIINYFLESMTKSKWNLMQPDLESEKVILSLKHLGFGFQICFFSAYIAFLTFFGELAYFWVKEMWKHIRSKRSKRQSTVYSTERNEIRGVCTNFTKNSFKSCEKSSKICSCKVDIIAETKNLETKLVKENSNVKAVENNSESMELVSDFDTFKSFTDDDQISFSCEKCLENKVH